MMHSFAGCINLLCKDFESMECARPFLKLKIHWVPLTTSLVTMSRFFLHQNHCDCNVKKFGYNEHPLITNSFFRIFLLVVNGTQCNLH